MIETGVLRERLHTLGKIANERFHYLNSGGCCVFAAAVAGELERLGVEHEVIVPGPGVDLNEIRENLPNTNNKGAWNDAGIYFGHVGVRMKLAGRWHTYDSDGFRPGKTKFGNSRYPYLAAKGGMTAKEAKTLADEAHGWNKAFRRSNVAPVRRLVRDIIRTGKTEVIDNGKGQIYGKSSW